MKEYIQFIFLGILMAAIVIMTALANTKSSNKHKLSQPKGSLPKGYYHRDALRDT